MVDCRKLGVLVLLLFYCAAEVRSQVAGPYGAGNTVYLHSRKSGHPVNQPLPAGFNGMRKPTAAERAKARSAAIDVHFRAALTANCSAGKYFVNDRCTNCPKGTFRSGDTADSTTCTKCLAPYSTSKTGSTSADDCNVCPPGYGAPRSGASCICAPCAKGYYSGGGPVQLCTQCPTGHTTKHTKATSVTDCSLSAPPPPAPLPGGGRCALGFRYVKQMKGCYPCPMGYFRGLNSTDDTKCTRCYDGHAYTIKGYRLGVSGQACTACQQGYGPSSNGPSCLCIACPKGTYSGESISYSTPATVNLPCIACPVGYTTNKTASPTITYCVPIDPSLVPTPEAQRDILLQGKAELLGPNQSGSHELHTWKQGTNMCQWAGIYCSGGPTGGAPLSLVSDISISFEQLNGRLPQAWAQAALATTLQTLSINAPPGSTVVDTVIPESWSNFTSLTTLRLSGFNLTGPLPTNWPISIQRIILDNNRFTGTVPESYSQLPYLLQLELSNNLLTGKLPVYLVKAAQLMYLNLGGNLFTGTLLEEWGALTNIVEIVVNNNSLTGGVPSSWDALSNLITLDISYNRLTELPDATFWTTRSPVPPSLSQLAPALSDFIADGNLFGGALPDYIGAWGPHSRSDNGFITLGLSNNGFTGGLPLTWQNLSAHMLIDVSNNHLSGPLPNETWARVQLIDLSGNQLTGTLPESWKDMGLYYLDVRHNNLTGPLPAGWSDWGPYDSYTTYDVGIFVSDNPLNCPIPPEWGSWDALLAFFADSCGLTGALPPTWFTDYTSDGYSKNLAIFNNPSLGGCVPGNKTTMWGPVTSPSPRYPGFDGFPNPIGLQMYQFYDWKDLNSSTQLQDWPPFSGTNVTRCVNGSTVLASSTSVGPPVPAEP